MTSWRTSIAVVSSVAAIGFSAAASAQGLGGTLSKIKETGSITLGYRESSVPFSYLDGRQQPVGISMDLCDRIVDQVKDTLGLPKIEVKKVAVNSSNRIPLVVNGTVDIECGGTANNAARQKQVAFSVATFASQPMWLARADAGIAGVKDLQGKTIVVTQGSNAVGFARKLNEDEKLGMTIIQAKDHGESMLTLVSGRAVAWLEDDILLAGEKANSKESASLVLLPSNLENIYYGLMMRKDDPQFKALVDSVLSGQMKSGAFTALYAKWFESPIPPRNVNLSFAMPERLKERIRNPSDKID